MTVKAAGERPAAFLHVLGVGAQMAKQGTDRRRIVQYRIKFRIKLREK